MPNTYSQIYIQIVFAVRNRDALITQEQPETLHKYIAGIIKNQEQKLMVINSMPDHIHIFISIKPNLKISDLVREIKSESSMFNNKNKLSKFKSVRL